MSRDGGSRVCEHGTLPATASLLPVPPTATSMPRALQLRAQHGGRSGGGCGNGKPPAATIPLSSAHQLAQLPAQLSLQLPQLVVSMTSWPSGVVLE